MLSNTMTPEQLTKWRREHGDISQSKLADMLGVSLQSVSNWEVGRHPIPETKLGLKERLDRIAEQKKKLTAK